ncbi:FAD-dependent oxidoreductase [Nocardioides sp. B-3]|uniref:FAD-dependent oxidoreductase n=1 Tax=Nocardioides sp. B-3 TaxID=2895565 RepID=UPI002153625C|nr:FAD-dependent oxidoreductase [Nocardioides sp. B-3]
MSTPLPEQVDVVVVGAGGAGMAAALAAASKHGLRTIVVESSETFGGSTAPLRRRSLDPGQLRAARRRSGRRR